MLLRLFTVVATAGPTCVTAADGIALFGDARLGLGYNINNDGSVSSDDSFRAVSRVRFGVNMTGAASGIIFGATIRADNAPAGDGGTRGQTAGNVFASGAWGTVTFGDTNGADENWVGDVPGNLSLTGLGDLHETPFVSNGGSFGTDVTNDFAANPDARPTVRYDFDSGDFGISVSTNRDLTDIQLGGGYDGTLGGGQWSVGLGYDNFAAFTDTNQRTTVTGCLTPDPTQTIVFTTGECPDGVGVPLAGSDGAEVPAGWQWSAGATAIYPAVSIGVTYSNTDSDGDAAFQSLAFGATVTRNDATVGAYWQSILTADGAVAALDGESSYGLTAELDLGGGANLAGGIARTFAQAEVVVDGTAVNPAQDAQTVADFGIRMSF